MYGISIYSTIALTLAAIVAALGAMQLAGPRFVIDAYSGWDYPKRVRVITGVLDIIATSMLAARSLPPASSSVPLVTHRDHNCAFALARSIPALSFQLGERLAANNSLTTRDM